MDILNGKELIRNQSFFVHLWLTVSIASFLYLLDVTVCSASQKLRLRSFKPTGEFTWVTNIKTVMVIYICFECGLCTKQMVEIKVFYEF